MARKPNRSPIAPRLSLESLEQRSLLAVAAFEIQLFEDVDGQPGAEITSDTVGAGDTFFIEITAEEFAPYYRGLGAVSLDIAWNPDHFVAIDDPFDPSRIITSRLPVYQTGRLDNTAGTISNLSAAAFLASDVGSAIGDDGPERFALLHFRALETTDASWIHMWPGRSRIVTVPASTPSRFEMDFERQMITVAPAASEPTFVAAPLTKGDVSESIAHESSPDFMGPSLYPLVPETAPDDWMDVWISDPNGDGKIDLGDFGAINAHYAGMESSPKLPAPSTSTLSAVDSLFAAAGRERETPASAALDDGLVQALLIALASAEDDDADSNPFTVPSI